MRFLFLGDIVGQPGFDAVRSNLPQIIEENRLDVVIANAENSSNGSGLSPYQFRELTRCGVDVVTMGDHIYRVKELIQCLEDTDQIVKPANFPRKAPGLRWTTTETAAGKLAVVSLIGRVYMKPCDCPFAAIDEVLEEIANQTRYILVDFHAEATGEKQTLGRYLDGRVTAVLGTHTHVTTADEMILPKKTAYQSDVGMCGSHESILGRSISNVIEASTTMIPKPFYVSNKDVQLHGTIVEADSEGSAVGIQRFIFKEENGD